MRETKNVLIVPSNTDLNRGDQSLTWASINIAKEVYGDDVNVFLYQSRGKLADMTGTNHQTEKLGYPLLARILSHPRRDDTNNEINFSKLILIKWGIRAVLDLIQTFLLVSKSTFLNKVGQKALNEGQRYTFNIFKNLDGLFVKGGGFLHSYGSLIDPYIMYYQLFDVFLAKRFNIPVFILPNSIGPLKNRFAKKIVLHALKYAKIVSVRESTSQDFLQKQGLKVLKSPDLGFYLTPSVKCFKSYLQDKGIPVSEKQCIAITLRPYRFDGNPNADKLYKNYLNQFMKLIKTLLTKDIHVTLIAHTIGPSAHEDDSIPLLEVYKNLKQHNDLVFLNDRSLNSEDVEKIYSYYDLVIGTRFHSVIFALNVNTPAIAIAYGGNKAVGIMNDMKLNEFVVPIENPDADRVADLADKIIKNKDNYLRKIKEYKIKLIEEKEALTSKLKKFS